MTKWTAFLAGSVYGVFFAWAFACGGGGSVAQTPVAVPVEQSPWQVGWMDDAGSYRVADGWAFDFPAQGNSTNYITQPTGSLAGKTKIVLRVRIETDPGARLAPAKFPDQPASLSLYFQRAGDDWTAQGPMESYRWYASFATVSGLKAGEYVIEAPLDGNWTAVLGSTRANNPQGFQDALNNAARVGFVLGGGDGLGHGVTATGPARLVITDFQVQ